MFAHLMTPSAPFDVDLTDRPLVVDYTPARLLGIFFMVFGLCWCGFSLLALTGPAEWPNYLFGGLLLSAGLAFFVLMGLRAFLFKRVVTFDRFNVRVKERGLTGIKDWHSDYSAFEGVFLRSFTQSRKHGPSEDYQVIELIHPEKLPITLKVVKSSEEPRAEFEAFARLLNLPAMRDGETRTVRDLDTTLADRVDPASFAEIDWTKPPGGMKVESADDRISVTLPPLMPNPALVFLLVVLLIPTAVVWSFSASVIFPIFFAVTTALPVVGLVVIDRMKLRTLEITRDGVTFTPGTFRTSAMQPRELPLCKIEEVTVGNGRGLRIATDEAVLTTGPGMSVASMTWLKNYVQAAIVSA